MEMEIKNLGQTTYLGESCQRGPSRIRSGTESTTPRVPPRSARKVPCLLPLAFPMIRAPNHRGVIFN